MKHTTRCYSTTRNCEWLLKSIVILLTATHCFCMVHIPRANGTLVHILHCTTWMATCFIYQTTSNVSMTFCFKCLHLNFLSYWSVTSSTSYELPNKIYQVRNIWVIKRGSFSQNQQSLCWSRYLLSVRQSFFAIRTKSRQPTVFRVSLILSVS
jgi:hypothetical protein